MHTEIGSHILNNTGLKLHIKANGLEWLDICLILHCAQYWDSWHKRDLYFWNLFIIYLYNWELNMKSVFYWYFNWVHVGIQRNCWTLTKFGWTDMNLPVLVFKLLFHIMFIKILATLMSHKTKFITNIF
jgi:hypothetical protein